MGIARPDGLDHHSNTLSCQQSISVLKLTGRRQTNSPPMYDCTPYQMTAMTARFRTGQNEPQIPKLDRIATGNGTWYFAPMRPVRQINTAAMKYPTQTQIQDCHHERPSTIIEEEIIQVFYTESVSACLEPCNSCACDLRYLANRQSRKR
jgi:hypothetical protein